MREICAPVSGGVSDLLQVTFREVVEDGVTLAMSSVARNFPRALRLYGIRGRLGTFYHDKK
jgi:hypothetical protein